jgi:Tfp pilus assembly protein PilV
MSYFKKIKLNNKGQSLAEILVALAVGIIFVLGVIIVAQFSLKIGKDTEKIQTSAFLARELLDKIKVFADSDWHNIYNLATTSANHYYLIGFTATSGDETIIVGTTTYTRYFYVEDVYRDASGKILDSCN